MDQQNNGPDPGYAPSSHDHTDSIPVVPGNTGEGHHGPGRRETTLYMPGEYGVAGWRLKIWANYPHRLARMVSSGADEETSIAMSRIVLWHNDWIDEWGTPYPALRPAAPNLPDDHPDVVHGQQVFERFWDQLPQELAVAIVTTIGAEVGKLAASVRNRR